jgi:hypothetical protein
MPNFFSNTPARAAFRVMFFPVLGIRVGTTVRRQPGLRKSHPSNERFSSETNGELANVKNFAIDYDCAAKRLPGSYR